MSLIPTPYKLLILVVFLLASHTYIYNVGKDVVYKEYNEFRVAVESANVKLKLENEQLRVAQTQQTVKLKKEYEDAIKTVTANYNSRLSRLRYKPGSCNSAVSNNPTPSSGSDETSSDNRSDYQRTCERLESDCAATTLQTIYLQKWINNVCLLPIISISTETK